MKRTKQTVTIKDVAKVAGVSMTTVSFVLNNGEKSTVGEETKKRVRQAIQDLGYVRQTSGRRLASGLSHTIGLAIGSSQHLLVDAVIPQVIFGINDVCARHGFRLMINRIEGMPGTPLYHELVRSKEIDGLIVLNPRRDDEELRQLLDERFPVVTDGMRDHINGYSVTGGDQAAAYQAVRHLIDLGHTRIGFLSFAPLAYQAAFDRHAGYLRALEDAAIPYDESIVTIADYTPRSGLEVMRELLSHSRKFTALFASNDNVALGAIAALYERKLRIPDDVALVGYDDIPAAEVSIPSLTTIRFPGLEYGRLATQLLLDVIQGNDPKSHHLQVPTELVVRASCGAKKLQ
jgi:DNA-binding LacI/PurR family transcriptional regulator